MANPNQLQHEYDTTRGLWCVDRNPADVDYEWIKQNAFQLKDYITHGEAEPQAGGIKIGKFTMTPSAEPRKIWMTGPSGDLTQVDERVLENLLASVF
jgi:hypothetical protein